MSDTDPQAPLYPQGEDAQAELEAYQNLFTQMDEIESPPWHEDPERVRRVIAWGVGGLIAAALVTFLSFRSGVPEALVGGSIALFAALFIAFNIELDAGSSKLLIVGLALGGGYGIIAGLLITPDYVPEGGVFNTDGIAETVAAQQEFQRNLQSAMAQQERVQRSVERQMRLNERQIQHALQSTLPPPSP